MYVLFEVIVFQEDSNDLSSIFNLSTIITRHLLRAIDVTTCRKAVKTFHDNPYLV